ncbi:hypothetical protein ES703_112090 [subsurface metagenome]
MDRSDIEICSNCGRGINRAEQAYVFEGNIVCAACDKELREGPQPQPTASPEPQAEAVSPLKPDEQEEEKQRVVAGKSVGFIIAGVILCLLGVGLIVIGLVGLAVFFILGGSSIGLLVVGGCVTFGMLILILGIAAIVVAVISRQRSLC